MQFGVALDQSSGGVVDIGRHPYAAGHDAIESVYIRTPSLENYTYTAEDSTWLLRPQASTLSSEDGTTTFVGRRQRFLDSTASTNLQLNVQLESSSVCAGLSVYKDCLRHASIYVDANARSVVFEVCVIEDKKAKTTRLQGGIIQPQSQVVGFRIRASREKYIFSWRESDDIPESGWHQLGEVGLCTVVPAMI
ncbi:hypothetical protein BX600DRAFT_441156 [Xylariales sp. PMI_506]|nr:hypothetical protein BX600DRAFT_441156 [Xylariales sp. PMI_506]